MSANDLESWMWAEAIRRLERAERLQHQVFDPPTGPRRQWEPPADVFETAEGVWVTVALPGVPAKQMTGLEVRGDVLRISGERRVLVPDGRAVLHRLEIPHGQFERHIALPYSGLTIISHDLVDGCLYLKLGRQQG